MKGNTGWGLRPSRDGAAVLQHQMPLWGVTEQGQRDVFDRDWDDFMSKRLSLFLALLLTNCSIISYSELIPLAKLAIVERRYHHR